MTDLEFIKTIADLPNKEAWTRISEWVLLEGISKKKAARRTSDLWIMRRHEYPAIIEAEIANARAELSP